MRCLPGVVGLVLALTGQAAVAEPGWISAEGRGIAAARYDAPSDVYPHRIMGSIREKHVLRARDPAGRQYEIDLRDHGDNVFEDIAPRVVDATGNGINDIVVVESDPSEGAQLAIYALDRGQLVKIAATPHIGTRIRWLAPIGIADLNGDGITDLAYVDRPHLAKTLRVWTWAAGGLTQIAEMPGVTNHRIGDEVIWGGLRDCGAGIDMVLADAAFDRVLRVRLSGAVLTRQDTELSADADGFAAAMTCP